MIGQLYTWGMLVKVVLVFMILYFYIPSRMITFEQESSSLTDKFFISLIHSNFVIILLVHVLAFLKLYETLSLVVACLAIYIWTIWIKGRSPAAFTDALGMKYIVMILDMSEGRYGLWTEIKNRFNNWLRQQFHQDYKSIIIQRFLKKPFSGILLVLVFVAAGFIRFKHSLVHYYFGASDSYLHLIWSKYLGDNEIYKDGIYPYGYHAVISALNKIFLIDPYYIVRFIGPLAGFLIVLSLFYILKKNFKNEQIAWLAVFIYGTALIKYWPNDVFRQMCALPMEYAAIFFLPGLHFLNMYFKHNKKKYLFLAGECAALTLLIHPYATVFTGIGYIIILTLNIKEVLQINRLNRVLFVMAGSIFTGVIPMIFGMLVGIKFHGSLGYIQRSVQLPTKAANISQSIQIVEKNPALIMFLVCMGLLALYTCILFKERRRDAESNDIQINIIFLTASIIFYLLYRANHLGLPAIMDPNRIAMFLTMMVVIVITVAFDVLNLVLKKQSVRYLTKLVMLSFIVIFLTVNTWSARIPAVVQMEYDDNVKAYLDIKAKYPVHNWTIISPVEHYQFCYGYGWHYEIWEFVINVCDRRIKELKIPTDYVFLVVEKIPFRSTLPVSRASINEALPVSAELPNETFYYDKTNRYILQSKAFFWAEEYIKTHKNMKVWRDTDNLRIYLLTQDGTKPVNLLY